jgi:hypothetical protein
MKDTINAIFLVSILSFSLHFGFWRDYAHHPAGSIHARLPKNTVSNNEEGDRELQR